MTAGSLMGTKTVLNELVAYVDFSKLSPTPLTTCLMGAIARGWRSLSPPVIPGTAKRRARNPFCRV
nr:hypothetical protein [Bradyrhizobium sp. Cp5.3]